MQIHGSTNSVTAEDRVPCHYDVIGAGEKDVRCRCPRPDRRRPLWTRWDVRDECTLQERGPDRTVR